MARTVTSVLALALIIGGGWGIWRWATYPVAPDAATADLGVLRDYLAGDEFARLTESDRLALALAYVERLRRETTFEDLVGGMMTPDPRRREMWRNLRGVEGREEVGSAFLSLFLDKYYDLEGPKRAGMLTVMALGQQRMIRSGSDEFGLPSVPQFKNDMSKFLSRQPPRVQGQMGQLLIDLKRQRRMLGLADPA